MVEFRWHRRKRDGTPIIRDIDIIEFTEEVLRDFKPELLETPGKFDPEVFIERYLGATIDYQDIYYSKYESSIAGATIFNPDYVAVFDRDRMAVNEIYVEADTIILDNSVHEKNRKGFAEFTASHEAGHFQLHQDVYKRADNQMDFYSMGLMERPSTNAVLCKRSNIGSSNGVLITDEDFREHQANTYAAAMLMPRRTFIPYIYELNQRNGYSSGIHVIMPTIDIDGDRKLRGVIFKASCKFGVSRSAVRVNMKKYGLLTPARDFDKAKSNLYKYTRW